jgi:hypothetical protein
MRLSSVIRCIEDVTIGAASKIGKASHALYVDLSIEAQARHMANVEFKSQKAQMIADCREAIIATDARFAARRGE